MLKCCSLHLDRSMHVGLFDTENNLPSNSDPVEQVVDETNIVDEGVDVAGAQHHQGGDQLEIKIKKESKRVNFVIVSQHSRAR